MGGNISGEWHGTYRYPAGLGPDTPFLASVIDNGGDLTGTIIEPDECRPATARATLRGHRFGAVIDFTKTYRAAGPEYDEPVDYVGRLSDDGTCISGVWSLSGFDGTFEMYRDSEAPPELDEAVSEKVTVDQPSQ